jgi:YidC/Oxa1 family membrane protein insertase
MNKQEKIIALLLGLVLIGWVFMSNRQAVQQAKEAAKKTQTATNGVAAAAASLPSELKAASSAAVATASDPVLSVPSEPEELVELKDAEMALHISSHGAVLKQATLSQFNTHPGKASEKNPSVALDFAASPALELTGLPGLPVNAAYRVERDPSGTAVTLTAATAQGLTIARRIELLKNFQVKVTDKVRNGGDNVLLVGTNGVSIGAMIKGISKNEMLSVDSMPALAKAKPHHWGSEKATKQYLVGMSATGLGCGGAPSAAGMPDQVTVPILEPQTWVAIKSRFFVAAFSSSEANCGFTVKAVRDVTKPSYVLDSVSARVLFPGRVLGQGETVTRDYTLFIGPKKLSLLQEMGNGMDSVMEFGMFTWFCKLLVPTLNFFHKIIPNYGVAILLLTFLVRTIFWPLTHKSTVSMRKMQEIQPQLKELQKKFKDNPQKMQQETWAIYRENKVNPLSSCLPMLIQIPVFIALFTVLRSAVELRYAPFLWIADLSEPENLLAGVLPIPLNILPFLMAATMGLQSYLTPSMGDPQQQKMMMIMMPIMMLFMFYSFPSALSLYWTVSQVLSIIQMWMIRRSAAHKDGPGGGVTVEAPLTRQQRRHAAS